MLLISKELVSNKIEVTQIQKNQLMYKKAEQEPVKIEIPFELSDWSRYHTGIYFKENKDIDQALQHTMERLVRLMPNIKKSSKILVFCGPNTWPVVFLGTRYGSKIDCVCFNEEEQKNMEKAAKDHGIDDKLTVHINTLEKTMFSDANFDIIWSMDLLHMTEDKNAAIREAARLLIPEGRFVISDYIKKKESSEVTSDHAFLTAKEYLRLADRADLERVYLREMAVDASKHLDQVLAMAEKDQKKLSKRMGKDYESTIKDIQERKEDLDNGTLDWAFFQFQMRNI